MIEPRYKKWQEERVCGWGPCGRVFVKHRRAQEYCDSGCQQMAAYERRKAGKVEGRCKECGQLLRRK